MARYIQQPQMRGAFAPRRFLILTACAAIFIFILFVSSFRPDQPASPIPHTEGLDKTGKFNAPGEPIAEKLGNATARAELGRAAWKVLHTTFARFPDKPTKEQSETLKQYIHLFQRVYPCGDCAAHFGELLKQFPPQVSSRSAAAAWGCHVHNQVNKRLKKELFDCSKIGDFYDCGCVDADDKKKKGQKKDKSKAKGKH